ncbi:Uncharacterised protein [Shigella sonnei]|nr:Uncharacterised protein [Shigella sonnei]
MIGFFRFTVIAFKADIGKLGATHQTRFDVGDAHRRTMQVRTQIQAKLTNKRFRRTVNVTTGIRPATCR